ncbi:hypothetical protein ASG63_14890 [Methylobacterium sp. Leaf94]|uniref:DUF3987 domain-containing protein n=1 Tax=Methylobacterium sp. Leaf94 TaxID=1736250 RepID=UPI0006F8330D|nr:DUF3987 domain-containing protein [Methylobacterium sp. Leaf94]KQU33182.1 hypothetical protein ASG63_14890 [Methylobacterium sp. Leaf94]
MLDIENISAYEPQDNGSPAQTNGGALIADTGDMQSFIRVAFGGIEAERGYIALRSLPNDGTKGKPDICWHTFGRGLIPTAVGLATEAANRTGDDAAVFAPPVCVFGDATWKGRRRAYEDNVIACRVVSLELDERPREMLSKAAEILGEPPTLLVRSGGVWFGPGGPEDKLHAYWRLAKVATTPEDLARLKAVRRGLTRLCGGDGTAPPLSHPMRWPGSWHTKAAPRRCAVIDETPTEISLEAAGARIAAAAEAAGLDLDHIGRPRRPRGEGFKTKHPLGAAELAALAAAIPNPADLPWDRWNHIGMTFWDSSHGSAEGQEAFDTWSAKNEAKYDPDSVAERWAHWFTSPPDNLSTGSLVRLAQSSVPGFALPFNLERWFDESAAAVSITAGDEALAGAPAGEAASSVFDDVEPIDIFGDADPSELDTPPDGAIPPIIGPWARDEARRKGVPLSLPVMAALSVIGAAIGCSLKIRSRLHDKREEPAALWVTIVADPGSVKSPVISAALDPLRKLDRENYLRDKPLHDAWAAKKRPRGAVVTDPEPKIRRCVVDDATVEQQIRIHTDNPRGIMRAPDELVGLLGSLGAYKKGAQVDRSMMLRMFDGEAIMVDRVGGGNRYAASGLMGILAGTQPDVLRELTRDLGTDGLLQRAIFILYDGRRRPELDVPPDHAAAGAYARAVRVLGASEAGSGVVELSPDAYAVLTRAEADFRAMSDLPGVSKAWQGHIAKWGKLLPRLTLICHALRHADEFDGLLPGVKVDKATAEQAVLLGRFVLRHSLRFYEDYFDARAETSEARKIAGYILTKPDKSRLSHRDLYEARKELRGADRAKIRLRVEIMGELERAGWCAVAERGPDGPVVWLINPKIRTRFQDRAAREVQDRNSAREKIIEAGKARKRMNTDTLSDGEA